MWRQIIMVLVNIGSTERASVLRWQTCRRPIIHWHVIIDQHLVELAISIILYGSDLPCLEPFVASLTFIVLLGDSSPAVIMLVQSIEFLGVQVAREHHRMLSRVLVCCVVGVHS